MRPPELWRHTSTGADPRCSCSWLTKGDRGEGPAARSQSSFWAAALLILAAPPNLPNDAVGALTSRSYPDSTLSRRCLVQALVAPSLQSVCALACPLHRADQLASISRVARRSLFSSPTPASAAVRIEGT